MSVTREEIARIAALAALDVDEAAMPALVRQLSRILEYVSQLSALDATGQAAYRPESNAEPQALRPDDLRPANPPLDPRAFAPDIRDGLFVVPRIGGIGPAEDA